MAHGFRDFGQYGAGAVAFPVSDMGELAARLGSINVFDRRGETVWMDDFEEAPLKWATGTGGTGASVARSTTTAKNGLASCLLDPGGAEDDYAYIRKYLTTPQQVRLGSESSFTYNTGLKKLRWEFQIYDGTDVHGGLVEYIVSSDICRIYDYGASTWVNLVTVGLLSDVTMWNILKLVIDYDTDKYVRLLLNEDEFDLSAYSLDVSTDSTAPHLRVYIGAYNQGGADNFAYIDDVIITQNEP